MQPIHGSFVHHTFCLSTVKLSSVLLHEPGRHLTSHSSSPPKTRAARWNVAPSSLCENAVRRALSHLPDSLTLGSHTGTKARHCFPVDGNPLRLGGPLISHPSDDAFVEYRRNKGTFLRSAIGLKSKKERALCFSRSSKSPFPRVGVII